MMDHSVTNNTEKERKTFEYTFFIHPGSQKLKIELNRLGSLGWELVAVDDRWLYFKREK